MAYRHYTNKVKQVINLTGIDSQITCNNGHKNNWMNKYYIEESQGEIYIKIL